MFLSSKINAVVRAFFMILVGLVLVPLHAATLSVAAGGSIQSAIDQAQPGDVVEVARGYYPENLVIRKTIVLRGIDRPTVSGSLKGNTISVEATDVVIEGLIVSDSGDDLLAQNAGIYIYPGSHRAIIKNNFLSYNLFGLWIEKAEDAQVLSNNITGMRDHDSAQRGNGVQLYNTTGAKIIGNEISFVRDALYIDVSHHAIFQKNKLHDSRYGTHYMNSYFNVWEDNDTWNNQAGLALMEVRSQIIRNNRSWNNADHGIMLRTLEDSIVENNIVVGNARGFFVYDVEYTVFKNNIVLNNAIGVHLSGSARNMWDGNDFLNNREQVKFMGTRDQLWGGEHNRAALHNDEFKAAFSDIGNYWSNYRGWDRDGNGRGDVPYEANDMVDRLLWRYPGVRLLLASPAIQTLRMVAQQFPVLRVPSVVEEHPRMQPSPIDSSQFSPELQRALKPTDQ